MATVKNSSNYEYMNSLSDSTWSLTVCTTHANEGLDFDCRRAPVESAFPRIEVLGLSDIETRMDEQINQDVDHWAVPPDLEAPGSSHPGIDVHRIVPYLSPTGQYPNGAQHQDNENVDLNPLFLSSFDSSHLKTVSLTGARLSLLLASPAFLPFLTQHLSTLK